MVDFRKLLVAQMLECSAYDGGWPEVTGLSPEEQAAYEEANAEAHRLDKLLRGSGELWNMSGSDFLLREYGLPHA